MKIFKITDKIKVKIKDIEIEISPLTFAQKTEVQQYMIKAAKGDIAAGMEGTRLAIKFAVKKISGVEDADGNEYKIELENNMLPDSNVEELLNCELCNELSLVCIQMLANIPKEFVDPNTGKKLEGVSMVNPTKAKAKKK